MELGSSALDPNEVAEVEALVEFVGICRYSPVNWRSTKWPNVPWRNFDSTSTTALRHCSRAFETLERVIAPEYAALLGKAAEVAAATEPKAVRAW